jgi:hypothetical protein
MLRTPLLLCALALTACASNPFVTSWKAPDAAPLQLQGAKVGAVVMMRNEAARRVAEDALAREISVRGGQGIPGYTLFPDSQPSNEAEAKAAFERAGMQGVVVMRPTSVDKEVVSDPAAFTPAVYGGYWGGYYGHGWGAPWDTVGGEIRTNTIVTIETLVYSLVQNKLVWAGQSRTTNPQSVNTVVKKLSAAAAKELEKQGLLPPATTG